MTVNHHVRGSSPLGTAILKRIHMQTREEKNEAARRRYREKNPNWRRPRPDILTHCAKGHPREVHGTYMEDQRIPRCKLCNKIKARKSFIENYKHIQDRRLQRLYGLTQLEWDQMLIHQSGRCAICSVEFKGNGPHTDHSHKTGKVRELLCARCNSLTGQEETNPGLFKKILTYIESHGG